MPESYRAVEADQRPPASGEAEGIGDERREHREERAFRQTAVTVVSHDVTLDREHEDSLYRSTTVRLIGSM